MGDRDLRAAHPAPAYRGSEAYVFVCYSHHDTAAVHADLDQLRAAGVRIWYDEGISPGTEWSEELARALDGAALVLFYATAASSKSRHCRDEINFAHNHDKQILPIYLDDVVLPVGLELSLSSTQAIHRHRLTDARYLEKMRDVLPTAAFATVGEGQAIAVCDATLVPARPRRRRRLILAAVAVLALGVVVLTLRNVDWLVSRWILFAAENLGTPIEQRIGFATAADGTRIAYATTGEGPPIVIVLGWATHLREGFTSPTYDPQGLLALTSERHRVVRYDGRGFGLSDRNVSDFSLDARVSDVEAVVDALGIERFALYALSAGGPVGIAYTHRHPDKVASLVLASTNVNRDYADLSESEAFRRMLDVFETSWDRTPAAIGLMLDTVFPELQGGTRELVREFLSRSANGRDVANFFRTHLTLDVADIAQQIRVPTLVIHGENDLTIPLEAGRQIASLIPNAKFSIVPGGHAAGTGGTPESRRAILNFIDSVPFDP